MTTKLVNGERVTLTAQEDTDLAAQRILDAEKAVAENAQRKKDALISYEKDQALEALIVPQKTSINGMSEAALDAAMAARGLTL